MASYADRPARAVHIYRPECADTRSSTRHESLDSNGQRLSNSWLDLRQINSFDEDEFCFSDNITLFDKPLVASENEGTSSYAQATRVNVDTSPAVDINNSSEDTVILSPLIATTSNSSFILAPEFATHLSRRGSRSRNDCYNVILPHHDGLGSFLENTPASTNRTQTVSTEVTRDMTESLPNIDHSERIRAWAQSQSRILDQYLPLIHKTAIETFGDSEWSQNSSRPVEKSLWKRFTKRVMQALVGLDEETTQFIFDELFLWSGRKEEYDPQEYSNSVWSRLAERCNHESYGITFYKPRTYESASQDCHNVHKAPVRPFAMANQRTRRNTNSKSMKPPTESLLEVTTTSSFQSILNSNTKLTQDAGFIVNPTRPEPENDYSRDNTRNIEREVPNDCSLTDTLESRSLKRARTSHVETSSQIERDYWDQEIDLPMVWEYVKQWIKMRSWWRHQKQQQQQHPPGHSNIPSSYSRHSVNRRRTSSIGHSGIWRTQSQARSNISHSRWSRTGISATAKRENVWEVTSGSGSLISAGGWSNWGEF